MICRRAAVRAASDASTDRTQGPEQRSPPAPKSPSRGTGSTSKPKRYAGPPTSTSRAQRSG